MRVSSGSALRVRVEVPRRNLERRATDRKAVDWIDNRTARRCGNTGRANDHGGESSMTDTNATAYSP